MNGRCDWGNPKQLKQAGCTTAADLGYLGLELCNKHWETLCEWQDAGKENAAYEKIGLSPRNLAETKVETIEETIDESDDDKQEEEIIAPTQPPRMFKKRKRKKR